MDTRRMLLTLVFTVSLLMLWDNYQRHIGQPTLFGLSSPSSTAPSASTGKPARGANDVPAPATSGATSTGVPASASDMAATPVAAETIEVQTDVLRLKISTEGGQIREAELLQHPAHNQPNVPQKLLESGSNRTYIAQTGFVGTPGAANHKTLYRLESAERKLQDGRNSLTVELVADNNGIQSRLTYVLHRGRYDLDLTHTLVNQSTASVSPSIYTQITRDDSTPEGESSFYSTFTGPAVYSPEGKYQKIDFSAIAKNSATFVKNASDGWVAMVQHYFVTALVPPSGVARENFARKLDNRLYAVGYVSALGDTAPGASVTRTGKIFMGPQDERVLEQLSPGLDLVKDYGWLTIVAKPLFWLLENLHAWVGNWGWAIVLLTVLVKLAFFPLSAASYKSMAKMRALTPRITRLREQYGDDKMRLNQAMMDMYRNEKINPLGGCLPVVVQIPVFLALYWVLLASVEMRNAPWIGWIHDLASPDPYFVLPVIMAISMFVQTKLNPTPPDPIQAKVMMMMPIVFSVMFLFFPSGLVLYWVVNNILSIAQQWSITRMVEGGTVKA